MRKLSRLEKSILLVVFALLVAAYTWWGYFRFQLGGADNAFLAQMVDRMGETGRPVSQVAEAVRQVFQNFKPFILTSPASELCDLALAGPGPDEFNYFRWHTLASLYLYLPVFKLLGGALGLALLTAVSFLMVNLGAYVLLRKHDVGVAFSVVIAALIALHPVWAGGILGQVYAERLWMGPAFVLCALLLTRRFDSPWLIPLALLLALTSERTGVVVAALLVGSIVLADIAKPGRWLDKRWLFALAALCAGFSAVILRYFEVHPDYEHFSKSMRPASFLLNLRSYPLFASQLLTFVAINFIAWGLPAAWCWRGMVLSLGVMLPNILGHVGGAEKVGFTTHYHSMYLPVLAVTICLSFVYVYKRYPRWASWAFAGWLAAAGLAFNIDVNEYDFKYTQIASRPISYPRKNYANEALRLSQLREVAAYLDRYPGSTVSVPEPFMPLLYRNHRIAFYPFGFEDSDFAMITKSPKPGLYTGAISYLGREEAAKIDQCLSQRLTKAGYRVEKEVGDVVVLSRRKRGPGSDPM